MGTNWVLENLLKALATWTEKMQEIWTLLTTSPQEFRGGTIWSIISNIHGGMKSIAYALLVLFFVIGVARTTTNFSELKRPEQALKLFVRFAIAKGVVTYIQDRRERGQRADPRGHAAGCDPTENPGVRLL